MSQNCQKWVSVGKAPIMRFLQVNCPRKPENMDKKMPLVAISVTTKGGKETD